MTLPMIIALAVTVLMIILIMVDKLPFGAPPLLALLLHLRLLAQDYEGTIQVNLSEVYNNA